MPLKIAYISYPVTDMDRAVEFYQRVLDCKPRFVRDDWSEFDLGGQRLALHHVADAAEPPRREQPFLSLLARPIEQVIETLKQRGVKQFDPIERQPFGNLSGFRDPDGNPIGLYEPPEKPA